MFNNVSPLTRLLILINISVFLGQLMFGNLLIAYFALWPINLTGFSNQPSFLPWQIVTYSFLHGGGSHLLFNMLGLYIFGSEIERVFGAKRFLNLYFISVISAAISQLIFAWVTNSPPYPTVGASGGLFGLLLAFAIYFPKRVIVLLIPPIPMPARIFVIVYATLELLFGITGSFAGVAHFAHLGGMLGAWLFIRYGSYRFK